MAKPYTKAKPSTKAKSYTKAKPSTKKHPTYVLVVHILEDGDTVLARALYTVQKHLELNKVDQEVLGLNKQAKDFRKRCAARFYALAKLLEDAIEDEPTSGSNLPSPGPKHEHE